MASMKKTGAKDWTVRWREGGRGRRGHSRQKTLHSYDAAVKFKKEKDQLEERRGAGISQGNSAWLLERFFAEKFIPLRSGSVTEGTVGSWKRRWLPTQKANRRPWHVGNYWGGWALEEINYESVLMWHAAMRKAGATDATMYRAHDLLVTILNFAVKVGYLSINPALNCQPAYEPPRVVDHWRPDTIEAIRRYLDEWALRSRVTYRWRRERDAVLVAILAYGGLRPGEALALTWRNLLDRHLWVTHTIPGLDDDENMPTIENGRTKTGRDRKVPFRTTPFLLDILLAWKQRLGDPPLDSPVIPAREGEYLHWNYNAWVNWRKAVWAPTLKGLELTYRKPYHLRHSALTMWIYAGVPINEVAKRAGHTMEVCMKTYAGAWDEYDPETDKPFDIEAAFKASRRESRRLRLVG